MDHQLWADVEQWNAIANHPPAREDRAIRDRLRERGGEPPTSDLIVWYWKGRPSATQ
jgi:hypothetical protein